MHSAALHDKEQLVRTNVGMVLVLNIGYPQGTGRICVEAGRTVMQVAHAHPGFKTVRKWSSDSIEACGRRSRAEFSRELFARLVSATEQSK